MKETCIPETKNFENHEIPGISKHVVHQNGYLIKRSGRMPKAVFIFMAGLFTFSMHAQVFDKVSVDDEGLFGKNTLMVKYSPGLDVGFYNWKADGEDDGGSNYVGVDYNLTYFFLDNIGAELKIDYSRNGYNDVDEDKDIYSDFTVGLAGVYGTNINDMLNAYGKLGFEVGTSKTVFKDEESETENKENVFGWRIEAGLPIDILEKGRLFVTPVIGYRSRSYSFDEGKQTDGSFYIGGQLNVALGCLDYACDMRNDWELSEDRYEQGTSFIGGSFYTRLNAGSWTTTYDDTGFGESEFKSSQNRFKFSGEAFYYVLDNIAPGASLYFNTSTSSPENSDNKNTSSSWRFVPMVIANAPVEGPLNNAFAVIGVGVGQNSYKSEFNGNETVSKDFVLDICAGVGLNVFFTDNLAYTNKLLYEFNSYNDNDNDFKSSQSGLKFSTGLNFYF